MAFLVCCFFVHSNNCIYFQLKHITDIPRSESAYGGIKVKLIDKTDTNHNDKDEAGSTSIQGQTILNSVVKYNQGIINALVEVTSLGTNITLRYL